MATLNPAEATSGTAITSESTANTPSSSGHNEPAEIVSNNLQQSSPTQRVWIPSEDALLLRTIARLCDLKEKGGKIWRIFQADCRQDSIPDKPERGYEETMRRCRRLLNGAHKYDVTLKNSHWWSKGNRPLWDEEALAADAQIQDAIAAANAIEDAESPGFEWVGQSWEGYRPPGLDENGDRDELESSDLNDAGSEQDKDEKEGETMVNNAEQAQAQQHAQNKSLAEPTSDSSSSTDRKRKLVLKANGERLHIDSAPEGTKVVYSPVDGSITIELE